MSGIKFDAGKPQLSLIFDHLPVDILMQVVEVFEFGRKKYGHENWKRGFPYSRLYDSALRHLVDSLKSNETDDESGMDPIVHVIANCIMLLWSKKYYPQYDDRLKSNI